jgi:hypothetical protein
MQFKTHNQKYVRIDGTSLQGYITTDYAKLKKAFGKPNNGDEYKIDAEWDIEFDDGLIATVYNWKDGKAYCGAEGTPKTKITTWHIGGKSQEAVDRIIDILEGIKL